MSILDDSFQLVCRTSHNAIFGAMASVKPHVLSRVCVRSSQDSESQYHSRAVAKALEILEVLGTAGKALGLNDLSQKLKLSKPSVFRLLFTLEETGYVDKDKEAAIRSSMKFARAFANVCIILCLRQPRLFFVNSPASFVKQRDLLYSLKTILK